MAKYKIKKCQNCSKNSRAIPSTVQNIINGLLFAVLIIPGIIYWFVSTGKMCFICGLRYKDSQK